MEKSSHAKPSAPLVGLSVVVLAGCLWLISASVAMFSVAWDPCSLIGGAILLPLPMVLVIQQYRGTFRYNAKAARISSVLLFVVAGFGCLIFVTTLAELILGEVRLPWFSLLLPMLAAGVVSGIAGWMNLSWSRKLKALAENVEASGSVRFSTRELAIAVIAIASFAALTTFFVRTTPPRYAENVTRDEAPFGLPAEAREISFCQGYRGTIAYEFTIDEASFAEWVESGIGSLESNAANVPVKSIARPFTMQRFHALSPELSGPESVTITEGLYYAWSKEDRGVYAAFDRTSGRAYYFAHFH